LRRPFELKNGPHRCRARARACITDGVSHPLSGNAVESTPSRVPKEDSRG
jgi:hypothetical protein